MGTCLVGALDDLGVVVHVSDADSLELAAKLAVKRNLGFFDAVVAERALRAGLPLLTTDKGLCNEPRCSATRSDDELRASSSVTTTQRIRVRARRTEPLLAGWSPQAT